MKVRELELIEKSDAARVQARVTWEDTKRDDVHLFYETNKNAGNGFWPDPNAFLLSTYLPAWKRGEKRVHIDGTLCPWLCDNMKVALTVLSAMTDLKNPPTIEPSHCFKAQSFNQNKAVSFLSGGVDSLATLYSNKKLLPENHPASIRAVIPIHYYPWKHPTRTIEEGAWRAQKRIRMARNVATDLEIDVIPVKTNVLNLYPDGQFYSRHWIGAIMSSIAHLFSKRFNKAYIASGSPITKILDFIDKRIQTKRPTGTYPLFDNYYTSGHLQVMHHGLQMDRTEKIKLISEWPTGLQNIFTCEGAVSGENNCGKCEKCIRTMTVLATLDKLKHSSFPVDDVSPELLKTLDEYDMINTKRKLYNYEQYIPLLKDSGRHDLVKTLNQVIDSWYKKHKEEEKKHL
jgi:7-cyano-7-deazaguanine synthase in queuosine biosynthesis